MDQELRKEFELGEGITMRAWRESDIQMAFDVVIRNREHLQTFMQWMTPDYSMESARKFITEGIANMRERKNAGWGIFDGERVIGSIGYAALNWPARSCEIGYWIDKDYEGKGIVTRACRVLIDYSFDELNMNRVEIRCSTENERSAAVPERLGFKREGVLRQAEMIHGRPHDFYIYGLLANDPRLW
jgi:ribosomal-protein-serine acetyltransferase